MSENKAEQITPSHEHDFKWLEVWSGTYAWICDCGTVGRNLSQSSENAWPDPDAKHTATPLPEGYIKPGDIVSAAEYFKWPASAPEVDAPESTEKSADNDVPAWLKFGANAIAAMIMLIFGLVLFFAVIVLVSEIGKMLF